MGARFNPGYSDPKGILIFAPGGVSVGGILAVGTTVPSDTTTGYAPGCIFIDRDAAAGSQVYINEGTAASSSFKAVSTASTGAFTNASIATLLTFANNANVALSATNGTMFGTNSNQKQAMWGATPVVQPSGTGELVGMNGNAGNATNAVNMNSNGNVGTKFYTFNDIVKALKQSGNLAAS